LSVGSSATASGRASPSGSTWREGRSRTACVS